MPYSDTRTIARAVRSGLAQDIYAPATSRLLWIPVHLAIIAVATWSITSMLAAGTSPFWLLPISLFNGLAFAGLAFVGHEALHGALTRNRFLRKWVGFVGFSPFWISPRLWIAWHNQVHHGNTNIEGKDPDMYPTLAEYQENRAARLAVVLGAPRPHKWRSAITLLLGFTLQSLQVLATARSRGYLSRRNYLLAWLETGVSLAGIALLAWVLSLPAFLLVYVVPLLIGNAIVMAHIVTNHSLSPLAEENDALETSLTVNVPRWFEFYTLGFGYHVEHHLYPAMSNRHGPLVQEQLRKVAPDRYQEMSLQEALVRMWSTPRVYKDSHTLFDPETGLTAPTLGRPDPSVEISHVRTRGADEIMPLALDRTSTAVSFVADGSGGRAARSSSIPPAS